MAKKIPWEMIRADYEAKGIGVSELERIYNVGKSTIHYRLTKENWELNKFEQEISSVVNTIQSISERATPLEVERIRPQIDSAVDLMGMFQSFVKLAANLNVQVLHELANEQDLKTRIMGLNSLKATFKDIADITKAPPVASTDGDKEMDVVKIEFVHADK